MQGIILISSYGDNIPQIEEEAKNGFVRNIIEQLNIPLSHITWNSNNSLSIEEKIKLRNILATYHVQVIDDNDGNVQIFVDKEKIAEWKKCTYKIKRDCQSVNPKKQFYIEMTYDFWSKFEEPT